VRSPGKRRGIALIAVLWVLVLLALMAANFTRITRTETNLARNMVENAKAEALADAAVHRAVLGLLETDDRARWRIDGTAYLYEFGGGTVRIVVEDEGGKIDLNNGEIEHLQGLFQVLGVEDDRASALADAIADFRDEDDLRHLNGAEDSDYDAAGLSYGAKDDRFAVVAELRQVLGMTRELYDLAAPFLTVYSNRSSVNTATAPREVLLAAPDMTDSEVEDILATRGSGEDEATAVSVPSATTAPGEGLLTDSTRVSAPVTLRAEAEVPGGAVFVREAVVQLTSGGNPPFQVLAWRTGKRRSVEIDEEAAEDGGT
jgi:general secretion pathway protein K